jgi:hypothetical protein
MKRFVSNSAAGGKNARGTRTSFSSEDPKLETIEFIRDHFLAKKVSWFNKYHFLMLPGLKQKYKALLGDKARPTSKMA